MRSTMRWSSWREPEMARTMSHFDSERPQDIIDLFDELNEIVTANMEGQSHMSSAADLADAIYGLRDRWAKRIDGEETQAEQSR